MLTRLARLCLAIVAMAGLGFAQSTSPNGVKTLNPPGAIKAEGTWSLVSEPETSSSSPGCKVWIPRPTVW